MTTFCISNENLISHFLLKLFFKQVNYCFTFHYSRLHTLVPVMFRYQYLQIKSAVWFSIKVSVNLYTLACVSVSLYERLQLIFIILSFFMLPKEENHIPKTVLKEIQKERVQNAMKKGGQRVAIDFTVSDGMRNKVSTLSIPLTG